MPSRSSRRCSCFDPRPCLQNLAAMVGEAFAMSEASSLPAVISLRIRTAHMRGAMVCEDNVRPAISMPTRSRAHSFDYGRLSHPPSTYAQEVAEVRAPAPRRARVHGSAGSTRSCPAREAIGIILQGGLTPTVLRGAGAAGQGRPVRRSRMPLLVLNVIHPLVPEEVLGFLEGKARVLVIEEGMPNFIEQELKALAYERRLDGASTARTRWRPTGSTCPRWCWPGWRASSAARRSAARRAGRPRGARPRAPARAAAQAPARVLHRLPGAAGVHRAEDRPAGAGGDPRGRRHRLPRLRHPAALQHGQYHSRLRDGAGLGGRGGPGFDKRVVSILGDGGFWHSGLTAGVAGAVFNQQDSVLVILENGYTSATGQQANPSTGTNPRGRDGAHVHRRHHPEPGRGLDAGGESVSAGDTLRVVREAMTTTAGGLKVVIAKAECQLERQRRVRPQIAARLKAGGRVDSARFGVDPDVCTGDKWCMRLNGCPSLTLRAKWRPAARGSRRPRGPELRRLRALRGGRARRRALPLVLRGAGGPQRAAPGSAPSPRCGAGDRLAPGA